MSPIKIENLPEEVELSREEAKKYVGGVMGGPSMMLPLGSFGSGETTCTFHNTSCRTPVNESDFKPDRDGDSD